MKYEYSPDVFNVGDLRSAKNIILTPEAGLTTDERWSKETPYLVNQISKEFNITSKSIILDYGCGVGRLSKALIEKYDCTIFGFDISPSMRGLSSIYTNSNNFVVGHPSILKTSGFHFDFAIAAWVLQHCMNVSEDIFNIKHTLSIGGKLFLLNNVRRAVPTKQEIWANDGIDIRETLSKEFNEINFGRLPPKIAPKLLRDNTFWATYEKV